MVKHTDAFNLAASALVAVTPSRNNTEIMFEISIYKSTDLPELEPPQAHLTDGDYRAIPVSGPILWRQKPEEHLISSRKGPWTTRDFLCKKYP